MKEYEIKIKKDDWPRLYSWGMDHNIGAIYLASGRNRMGDPVYSYRMRMTEEDYLALKLSVPTYG